MEPLNSAPLTPKSKTLDHELQHRLPPPPLPAANHRRGEGQGGVGKGTPETAPIKKQDSLLRIKK